jgi:demethylmenaquinone methyltransferase/2-methoxy-6-polyprenyl-1,4-benzoquinol methylase
MFGAIAGKYDLANSVLSLGIHHLWRRRLVKRSGAKIGDRIFDAATGTGDLAFALAKVVGPQGSVIGGDFSEPMLERARVKQAESLPWLSFQFADVMQLPFPDESFDIVTISFGIRNVSDAEGGLKELLRVLKPGGRLMVLEFGTHEESYWLKLFGWYSRHILPLLGGLVTGERGAYRYLQESSSTFPARDAFVQIIKRASPSVEVQYEGLSGGIAYLYRCVKG